MNSLKVARRLVLPFVALSLCLATPTLARADEKTDVGTADRVLRKVRELDLLNQILPVLMTKKQLSAVLTEVEKARANVKKTEAAERDALKELEKKLDPAIESAYKEGKVPEVSVLSEYLVAFAKMNRARGIIIEMNTTNVLEVLKKTLNTGQLAAARNALNPKAFDPSADVTKMTDDEKLRYWVKMVLLDVAAYEVLVRLSKSSKN